MIYFVVNNLSFHFYCFFDTLLSKKQDTCQEVLSMSMPLTTHPLTEEQQKALKILTRQAVGRVAERARMILLSAEGKTASEISKIFHCSFSKVKRWIKRYQAFGLEGLYDKPRQGRPAKVTDPIKQNIDRCLQKSPQDLGFLAGYWTIALLISYLFSQFGSWLSVSTLRRTLHQFGYRCRRPRLAAARDDPAENAKLEAISEVFKQFKSQPDCVFLYEDETTFRLLPLLRRMWMKLSQQLRIITPSSWNRSFSVFGALNALDGRFHYAIFSKMTGETFIAFLEDLLSIYPGKLIFLILDNASYHTSGIVKAWLQEHQQYIRCLWLPKRNPQLNPVEKIWWHVKDKVAANRAYESLGRLKESVNEFFAHFTLKEARKLASLDSLPEAA
jgi:transposase